jgi:hypothetical protein
MVYSADATTVVHSRDHVSFVLKSRRTFQGALALRQSSSSWENWRGSSTSQNAASVGGRISIDGSARKHPVSRSNPQLIISKFIDRIITLLVFD